MKAHESVDESVAGAHAVGNGCAEPTAVFSYETATRLIAVQANARVRGAQWPTSGAPPAPSTRQAHQFLRFFFQLLPANAGEPGMSHHRERDVAVPTVPEAYFILI
jgi:hypothetical protein